MEVQGRCAIVTGGGSGIGRGIAIALADAGCSVAVADLRVEDATAVAKEIQERGGAACGIECDVTSETSVEAAAASAIDELGGLDIAVNNAGVIGGAGLLDSDARDFRWILEVNLVGAWHGCKVFGRHFRDQATPAWIVNTGSEHSLGFAHAGVGFYTASKHALLGLTDVLRDELPEHVGVSLLCPGVVQTDLWNAARNRPDAFGGEKDGDDFSRKLMGHGMGAEEVGQRVVAGIRDEEFLIVTHSHVRRYARERWQTIDAAFERQLPDEALHAELEVPTLAGRVLAGNDD